MNPYFAPTYPMHGGPAPAILRATRGTRTMPNRKAVRATIQGALRWAAYLADL